MNRAGAVLQLALFEMVQADADLLGHYAPLAEAEISPQFSYDGMRSQWLDRGLGISRHAIEYSVWTVQAAFAQGDDITGRLIKAMPMIALAPPFQIEQMRLQAIATGFDGPNRLWRQQLEFEAFIREIDA